MEKRIYNNEDDFLNECDGKIYAIATADNSNLLCDLEEENFIQFCNKGKVFDLHTTEHFDKVESYNTINSFYVVAEKKFEDEVFNSRIEITIGK